MGIKCVIKLFGALIFLSFIFLNGCDVDSPTAIHANVSSVSAKIAKAKHHRQNQHQSYQHLASADPDQWLPDDPKITVSTGNFWDRLRGSFQLNHCCDNPKVKAQINWFCHHQGYLNRSVKRASPYMYYIFEQVQKRNLPGELLLLPFIESAFNPFAYSGPGAAGLWQIMPQTGSGFGLKQNWWYDGRRDVHASTNAALDYLTYLQSYFDGDWLLATAAYNTGEGTVQQAIRRNARLGRNTDFFSLGLSQETQSYVPRLLALATIISNPEDYPISLPPVRDEPYLAEVTVGCQIDLTEAAQLAGISQEEMRRLNPAYRHKLTRPHSACRLLIPISQVETFKTNLKQLSVVNQISLQRYKVKRGETIDSIASHFQVSSLRLRHINHLRTRSVRPGRTIFVPVESPIMTGNPKPSKSEPSELPSEKDTSVSKKFIDQPKRVSEDKAVTNAEAEKQPEKSEKPENLEKIEKSDDSAEQQVTSSSPRKVTHRLKKGETLQKLAARYQVKVKDLQRWNHLSKHARLRQGRVVVIWQHREPIIVKTAPHGRRPAPCASPSRRPAPCASPSRRPAPCSSPSRPPAPCSSPSRRPATCSSPSRRPATCSSPSRRPATCSRDPVRSKESTKPTMTVLAQKKALPAAKSIKPSHVTRIHYKVLKGETLAVIAKKNHVSTRAIMKWNHLRRPAVHAGQVLVV